MDRKMTVTALRNDLYRVIDEVLETGVAIEVERNGRTVLIAPARPAGSKLSRLKPRNGIVGDPDDLVSLDIASWHEPDDLRPST